MGICGIRWLIHREPEFRSGSVPLVKAGQQGKLVLILLLFRFLIDTHPVVTVHPPACMFLWGIVNMKPESGFIFQKFYSGMR